jgi:hypothetical protein
VPPPDKRLEPGGSPVSEEDLRLVMQLELTFVDPAAQVPEQGEPGR